MGCSPSRGSGILVHPSGPDIAKVTPVTAAGAPLLFDSKSEFDDEGYKHDKTSNFDENTYQNEEETDIDYDKTELGGKDWNGWNSPSAQSRDSGISELEEEYAHVITETSDPLKVKEIEQNFQEGLIELEILGKGISRKLSPKDKERVEEQAILTTLREEGLVPRPPSRKNGGLRFEIVSAKLPINALEEYPGLRKLPPLSVQKALNSRRKSLTKQDIEEKLEKAEERRKMQEEEKLGKLTVKPRIEEVMSNIEQQSQEIKEKHDNKMEAKAKCREEKLKELQSKLRNHQQHVENVRHRKQLISAIPDFEQSIGHAVQF